MNFRKYIETFHGFRETELKVPIRDTYALSLVYTPGVGKSCLEIKNNPDDSYLLTNRANSIAVIGYGDKSTMPFLEAKASFYREHFGIDAYPFVIKTDNNADIANVIYNLTPNFAGFDLTHIENDKTENIINLLPVEFNFPVITGNILEQVRNILIDNSLSELISVEMALGAILKGCLDLFAKKLSENIEELILQSYKNIDNAGFIDEKLEFVVKIAGYAANSLLNIGFARNSLLPEQVESRLYEYFIRGKNEFQEIKAENVDDDINLNSLMLHKKAKGVIKTKNSVKLSVFKDNGKRLIEKLSEQIAEKPDSAYDLTSIGNTVAIISDGSAVLGLGNIGAEAGLPVMEGKSALFKSLAGVDAIPLCLKTQDPEELINVISLLSDNFGGINLEDISAPRCFIVENKLKQTLDIPVFHDDQHGTAVVVLAGFMNALKLLNKKPQDVKVVVNGAGAGAIAVSELLIASGVSNIILCDTRGAIYEGRAEGMNPYKEAISSKSNPYKEKGLLQDVMKDADFFIGLSKGNLVTPEMVKSMADKPVIFALANPVPEIMPDIAKTAGAYIVATGRSDFKNQINNSLAFPGLFRGALAVRAKNITDDMKISAANAIADLIDSLQLDPEYIIPGALDLRVPPEVAYSVAKTAIETGMAKKHSTPVSVREDCKNYLYG